MNMVLSLQKMMYHFFQLSTVHGVEKDFPPVAVKSGLKNWSYWDLMRLCFVKIFRLNSKVMNGGNEFIR